MKLQILLLAHLTVKEYSAYAASYLLGPHCSPAHLLCHYFPLKALQQTVV